MYVLKNNLINSVGTMEKFDLLEQPVAGVISNISRPEGLEFSALIVHPKVCLSSRLSVMMQPVRRVR